MVKSIVREIELQNTFFKNASIQSIYFGGGTPSLLSGNEIRMILDKILCNFNVQSDVELTLEANPDDITAKKLEGWLQEGINRLSLGIQSLDNQVLQWMNRAHNEVEVIQAMDLIRQSGIDNYSVDFIFGIPNQEEQYWQKQIEWIIKSEVPHVACYNLTVEEGTALNHRVKRGKDSKVDEMLSMKEFVLAHKSLSIAGYDHYEISNYCKPGRMSRHNSAYWKGKGYLGIGPSAHSYYKGIRSWNIANNASYMDQIEKGVLPVERETLSDQDRFNEYVMLGFRTKWGLDMEDLRSFKENGLCWDQEILEDWLKKGCIIQQKESYILSLEGKLIADEISASLFVV